MVNLEEMADVLCAVGDDGMDVGQGEEEALLCGVLYLVLLLWREPNIVLCSIAGRHAHTHTHTHTHTQTITHIQPHTDNHTHTATHACTLTLTVTLTLSYTDTHTDM